MFSVAPVAPRLWWHDIYILSLFLSLNLYIYTKLLIKIKIIKFIVKLIQKLLNQHSNQYNHILAIHHSCKLIRKFIFFSLIFFFKFILKTKNKTKYSP